MKTRKQRKGAVHRRGSACLGLPYGACKTQFLKTLEKILANQNTVDELAAQGVTIDYDSLLKTLKKLFPSVKKVPDFGVPGKHFSNEPVPIPQPETCPGYFHPSHGDVITVHTAWGMSVHLTPHFLETRYGGTTSAIRRSDLTAFFKYRSSQTLPTMFNEHLDPISATTVSLNDGSLVLGFIGGLGLEATRVVMAWALRTEVK